MLLDLGDHEASHLPLYQKWLHYKKVVFKVYILWGKFSQKYGQLGTFFFMQNNMHLIASSWSFWILRSSLHLSLRNFLSDSPSLFLILFLWGFTYGQFIECNLSPISCLDSILSKNLLLKIYGFNKDINFS